MKKLLCIALSFLLVISLLTLTACSSAPSSSAAPVDDSNSPAPASEPKNDQEMDVLRVAICDQIVSAPVWLADREGYFAEENIRVELTSFTAMAPAIAAMASGDIDISYMGAGVHPLAAEGQVDIFMLHSLSLGDYLLGNKSNGIETLDDLKGKTIALPKGSTADMLVNVILQSNGYDPADFNIINMDAAGVVAAMTAGKIDACGAWEPSVTEIMNAMGKENVSVLGVGGDYTDEVAFPASWGANPKVMEENRDLIVRFTRAFCKANAYLEEHPEEIIEISLEETQGTREALEAQKATTRLFFPSELKTIFEDGSVMTYYDGLLNGMKTVGVIEEFTPAEDYVDTSIVTEALA